MRKSAIRTTHLLALPLITAPLAAAPGGGDEESGDYGTELDLSVTHPINAELEVGAKLADYSADGFATDTTKAWLWLGYSF